MKISHITLCLSLVSCVASCVAPSNPWPDLTFIVRSEHPELHLFERVEDVRVEVPQVLLLPIVGNYSYHGRRHQYAIADPLWVEPGVGTVKDILSVYNQNRQMVVRCIVLARGYAPGKLQFGFNYEGTLGDGTAWIIELPRLSPAQSKLAAEIIMRELDQSDVVIGPERTIEQALDDGQVIGSYALYSPIVRPGVSPFRVRYALWPGMQGRRVPICFSEHGRLLLRRELEPPGTEDSLSDVQ